MATTNFRSGKAGRLTIGAANLQIKSWRVVERNEIQDVTNTESSGHGEYIGGVTDQDCTINFDVTVTVFPFGTTAIAAGTAYTISLVESTNDSNTTWTGSLVVETLDTGLDVRGTLNGTITGKFSGAPSTRPTS